MRESHSPQRRLLITTYHYDRAYSMESRLSWQRAQSAAAEYAVTVISARPEFADSAKSNRGDASGATTRPIELRVLPLNRLERALMSLPGAFYLGYRLWHRRAYQLAARLHAQRTFDVVHHVSFCGYREPSDGWKLGVPFVWGPIGGTQSFPIRFVGQLGMAAAAREIARNVANYCQLKCDPRVRTAARTAAQVLAANESVACDLRRSLGIDPLVQLETAADVADVADGGDRPRRSTNAPLRILWSGRLQPWKGLPLLLRALAALPAGCSWELRVLGQGPCLRRWRRLAHKLRLDGRIQWVGWPEYASQLPHYCWADVFAFTSLRDTSGTGLLEALAAGAPIVGLNHQGAADIMTDRCAIAVEATQPKAAIAGFRQAFIELATDADRLHALSQGAVERAEQLSWDRQWELMRSVYEDAAPRPAAESTALDITSSEPAEQAACLIEA